MNKIKYFFIRTYERISNVIRWLPIIWQARDWGDYAYTIEIFKFQLENLAKSLDRGEDGHTLSNHKSQQIRTAIRLMNKAYSDDYFEDYLKEIKLIPTSNYKERDLCIERYMSKKERAHKLLWKYIEQNIQSWWD